MSRMKPTLVHGSVVPEIDDSFSPDAVDFVGSIIMKGLSCAFTWNTKIRVYDDADLDERIDRLPLAVSTWHRIIELCHIAVSHHVKRNFNRSKVLITESFIPLLEIPGIQTNCTLVTEHRDALKHVLDSTSAFIQLSSCDDYMARRNLYDYAKTIISFDSMDKMQRAAVHAIRSQLTEYPENMLWAREAVKLNPEEGQWHYYLAEILFEADQRGKIEAKAVDGVFKEIMKHNSLCLKLRQDSPEPFFLLAEILVLGVDADSSEKSYVLVQNALKKFPNSAYVHARAADILQSSQPTFYFMPKSYLLIEPFYKKALKLAGKECLAIRHKLGLHQVLLAQLRLENFEGIRDEGLKNLALAAQSIPDARLHLTLAMNDALTSSVIGIQHMPMPILCREDSSSDSSEEDHTTVKISKKKKKRKGKGKGKRK